MAIRILLMAGVQLLTDSPVTRLFVIIANSAYFGVIQYSVSKVHFSISLVIKVSELLFASTGVIIAAKYVTIMVTAVFFERRPTSIIIV